MPAQPRRGPDDEIAYLEWEATEYERGFPRDDDAEDATDDDDGFYSH